METTTAPDARLLLLPAHPGTRYEPEVRELARQLWSFRHGRNCEAVTRELAAIAEKRPEDRHPADPEWPAGEPVPTARTVRRWAEDGGWAERAEADFVAIAPAIHRSIVVDLIAGAQEGAAYLRACVRGDRPAEPARVNAAHGLLDRAGFKPRDGSPLALDAPATDPDADRPLTPRESVERHRQILERRRAGRTR